jgi:hypothetical protein
VVIALERFDRQRATKAKESNVIMFLGGLIAVVNGLFSGD